MAVLARDRLELALARIADPSGEGDRTFLTVYPDAAREAADAADQRARNGVKIGSLDGAIVSIKDLFDVTGEPTRAGSMILANAPAAQSDALIVRRLREAGAVIVGKTNMSEFAFTGVGANPHFGTPANPADRKRVPGGSSSGAAVAVADDMCEISIGTDTGGSTRIPAALCGIVGYKPTKRRISTEGAFPLSPTLDSVGPIAKSVAGCATADAILAGEQPRPLDTIALEGIKLAIPQGIPLRDLDDEVARSFDAAVTRLGRDGVILPHAHFSLFDDMKRVNSAATIGTVEAFHIHRERLATRGADIDPVVRERIEMGSRVSQDGYQRMLSDRRELAGEMDSRLAEFDALVLPTTPITAPTIAEVSTPAGFRAANELLLRNTAIANFFDLCAISLPMSAATALPTGLMLFARSGEDRRLMGIAASIERLFAE